MKKERMFFMKKISFLSFGKIFLSIGAILLSLLCFPGINRAFFTLPSGLSGGLWAAASGLPLICSAVLLFLFKRELPLFDLISPILFLPCVCAVIWLEAVFLQYDTVSKNLVFRILGLAAVAVSVILSAYWFRNARKLRGEGRGDKF